MKRDKRKAGKAPVLKAKRPRPAIDRRHALLGVVLLLTLLAYSNSFRAPFLMDNAEILGDTRFHAATSENVDRIFNGSYHQSTITNLYRPATSLSYLYNYAVRGDGADPSGYHAFNFLLHVVNIALVYALGLILFEGIPAALALAALWGAHPVLTEAVTNIVGRADMLAAFGVLGAVVAYHHSLRLDGLARTALLAAIALATTVGVFSKESGIVVVAAVVAYDQIFARGMSWSRRIPGWSAVIVPSAVFLFVRARVIASLPIGPFPFTDNPIVGAGFVEGRMTAFQVIAKYVGLLLWPAKLAPDYSYNEIPVRVTAMGVVGLLLCLAAAALAVWAWRKHRALTFAIALFFVGIAPVSNLFLAIGTIMGERFLYLPAVGFAAAIVYGLDRLWTAAPHRRTAIAAAVGVVSLAFAVRAHTRNEDWNDDRRFWEAAVKAAPGSYKPRVSILGSLPRNTPEEWRRALDEAQRALAVLDPLPDDRNSASGYRNAGVMYRGYGDYLASSNDMAGATQWYQRAVAVLLRSERIERNLDERYRAINGPRGIAQSTYLPAAVYRELGITYLKLNQLGPALNALEVGHGLEADPDLLENLALAYGLLGDVRKGVVAAVEALEVDSKRTYLADKLLATYKLIDPSGCPVRNDAGGESLNIECPMVHDDICTASRNVLRTYMRRNQTAEAASIRRVAIQDLGCAPSALD